MKVPQIRYRQEEFFGDTNWHSSNIDGSLLGLNSPFDVIIGITTNIHSSYGDNCTKIKSEWLWRYGFTSGNASNFWGTATGSSGDTHPNTWGVGLTTSTWYSIPSSGILEGFITSGTSSIVKKNLTKINFSSATDWYFEPSITCPSASNRAIVLSFVKDYNVDLPSNSYTISNNTIEWNMNHPVIKLLYGQICTPY